MALLILLLVSTLEGWTATPVYRRLFAPRAAEEAYRTYVTPRTLEEALAAVNPGVEPRSVGPIEAFGQSGSYNRWKLARLYGATRVRVARLPRIENGHVVEAWTLVSPYPDPALERLEPGTLLIVLRLDRAEP